jgi:hypothetical protein
MRSKANVSHISDAYQGCDYRRAIVIATNCAAGFLLPMRWTK